MERGQAGVGAGDESKQKKKKESRHSTPAAIMHQGKLVPQSQRLLSHRLFAYSRLGWGRVFIRGEKPGLVPWRGAVLFRSPPAPRAASATSCDGPVVPVLCRCRLGAYDFLSDTNTAVTLLGLQTQVLLFSQRIQKWDLCVQTRTSTAFRKGVSFSFKINRTADKAPASENVKELGGTLCNIYCCSSARHLGSTFGHSYTV